MILMRLILIIKAFVVAYSFIKNVSRLREQDAFSDSALTVK